MRLADEIYAQQPTMLASILALPRMGVDMAQLEVVRKRSAKSSFALIG